jgi:hypothetical protein
MPTNASEPTKKKAGVEVGGPKKNAKKVECEQFCPHMELKD